MIYGNNTASILGTHHVTRKTAVSERYTINISLKYVIIMRYFLFFTLLLTTSFASAQTKHSVEGVVVDSLGQGVVGAVVSCLLDDQVTAATISDGDGFSKCQLLLRTPVC